MKQFIGWFLWVALMLGLAYGLPSFAYRSTQWFLVGTVAIFGFGAIAGLCFLIAWLIS